MAQIRSARKKKKLLTVLTLCATSFELQNIYKRKRSLWSRAWLLRRKKLGCYENLMRELALEDAEGYRRWLRMDTAAFEELLQKVTPVITKCDTTMREAIPAGERLAITLRYLATGETRSSLSYQFRIAQNTISGILPVVCKALCLSLQEMYFRIPTSEPEWKAIAKNFEELWNFPSCLGAIDGKHVKIQPPPGSGSTYFNYKGFHSMILLALVDADLKFIFVDIGTNGRSSDGGVWGKCKLKQALDDGSLNIPNGHCLSGTNTKVPFVIVADDAFPLIPNIMKPYPGKGLNDERRMFNYRLSRARRVSENAFGILASRFQIFSKPLTSSLATAKLFVLTTCILHNFLRSKATSRAIYTPMGSLDVEDIANNAIIPGTWRNEGGAFTSIKKTVTSRPTVAAKEIQNRFCSYFNSDMGSVPWQQQMCNLH